MLDEHVYYWAWQEEDNPSPNKPQWFRVFRVAPNVRDEDGVLTEPMTRDEAKAACQRIVKITGGREI